ncbi:hypothetical protein [Candidatus Uabimicrobium sp. HlEnr_7]|uniref:hypothetical protein n=1 Tax=Candidatus Uabimicrobium helgolandensis TaxID=3095367 RepID=UPI0035575950
MDLQLVVLNNFYDCSYNNYAKVHFGNIIDLKIQGYSTRYNYGVLPFNTSDYFATHFSVVEKNSQKMLMTYKTLSYSRCQQFNQTFPALALVMEEENQNQNHQKAIQSAITEAQKTKTELLYHGGFTIHPDYRRKKNKKITHLLFRIAQMCKVNYALETSSSCALVFITEGKKFHKYFTENNYQNLEFAGENLGPVTVHSIASEKSRPYISRCFIQSDEQVEKYWNERIVLAKMDR